MWTGQEMTFLDTLSISALGLIVVFTALVCLALAIVIITKILGLLLKPETAKQAAVQAAAVQPAIDEESYAVILAAVSEEARLSGEQVRVTSIKEI